MSIDATRWAWEQQVTPAQKLVLLSLADRANEHHECYPSTARLCQDTGLYRETIHDAIKALEDMGLIEVYREFGKSNRFTLLGVVNRHETSLKKQTGSKISTTSRHNTTSRKKPTSRQKPHDQSEKADSNQSEKADTESTNESINNHISENSGFDDFWKAYPRKVCKDAAQKAWVKCKPPLQDILQALAWQVRSEQWRQDNGAFIPYPATYLNQARWKDEPTKLHTTAPIELKLQQKKPHKPLPKERVNSHIANMHDAIGRKARRG